MIDALPPQSDPASEPVTVIIRRRVKPGREREYETWLQRLQAEGPFATPYPLRLLVTIGIEVVLMTWWLMPWITRRLAPSIYPLRRTV